MGCINSKNDLTDINPNIFRVSNIDSEGTILWNGQLEISRTELTLYRKGKKPTQWPLQCLRRYGYDADLFSFEAGRRCDTGPGIYAFRCRRAETLFHMLQNYIQGRAYSTDETIAADTINGTTTTMPRNHNAQPLHGLNCTSSRPNSGSLLQNRPPTINGVMSSQSLSPNGTVHSQSNQSRSSDTLTGDGNYLEPIQSIAMTTRQPNLNTRFTSGMRLSSVSSGPLSPDLASPGSPSSITNILEVTTLNPLPNNNTHGVSNLYQEFPISAANNATSIFNTKKLTVDVSPHQDLISGGGRTGVTTHSKDLSKSISLSASSSSTATASNALLLKPSKSLNLSSNGVGSGIGMDDPGSPPTAMSPNDATHSYMNISVGDFHHKKLNQKFSDDSPHLTTSTPTGNKMFGYPSNLIDSTRCYENLDCGGGASSNTAGGGVSMEMMRPLLLKNHPQYRCSKPDIFAKVDLPVTTNSLSSASGCCVNSGADKSEPCTPTNAAQQERTVNYIILDLNEIHNITTNNTSNTSSSSSTVAVSAAASAAATNCLNNNNTNSNNNNNSIGGGLATTNNNSIMTGMTVGGGSGNTSNSLLPPESPKNASLGYATIDFNKTVALSNSTNPSQELDSEGSRKTRHSSTIPPAVAAATATTRHSNSISD